MGKSKIFDDTTGQWIILDAKNAETLGGKSASDFALIGHNHDTVYSKIGSSYTKTESDISYAKKSNNLSDLSNTATARANLGLGSAATQNSSAFATAGHKHDSDYVKGNYTLVISGTAPTASLTTMWWDTVNNLIKRHNGTDWAPLNGQDAATLGGASKGTGANNILQLNSTGKVPAANLPLASSTSDGAMSIAQYNKLFNIADNANNYVHPANHPASIITQDANNRFVTDSEKSNWNSKAAGTHSHSATDLPSASTTAKGVVQLNDAIDSTSTSQAATANAVKKAYDLASSKAGATHTHAIDDVTNLSTQLADKLSKTNGGSVGGTLETENFIVNNTADFYSGFNAVGNISYNGVPFQSTQYKMSKSGKDSNGIFTVVEYKRGDGTLAIKSTLSGGTSPNYTTRTVSYYNLAGTSAIKTLTFTLSYDSDGDLISEV